MGVYAIRRTDMQADNCRGKLYSHDIIFVTPILRERKYGSLGVKVWHFWVVNRMVWREKCHSYALHFAESTRWLLGVDSLASPSRLLVVSESTPLCTTTRLRHLVESTRRGRGVDSKNYKKKSPKAMLSGSWLYQSLIAFLL